MTREICGLYAVTPNTGDTRRLLEQVEAVLDGGARLVQYRNKQSAPEQRRSQVRALLALCRPRGIPVIVNDHLDLAIETGADGLHLGGEDGSIHEAREKLGRDRLLGASCYNRIDLAIEAVASGADHVAFGSFFPSPNKPDAVRAPIELLSETKDRLRVPVVAIGGITPDNAGKLVAAGADALAVISALFDAPDPGLAARRFQPFFERQRGEMGRFERQAS